MIHYDAGCWVARQGNALIALVGWVVRWPAWLLIRRWGWDRVIAATPPPRELRLEAPEPDPEG